MRQNELKKLFLASFIPIALLFFTLISVTFLTTPKDSTDVAVDTGVGKIDTIVTYETIKNEDGTITLIVKVKFTNPSNKKLCKINANVSYSPNDTDKVEFISLSSNGLQTNNAGSGNVVTVNNTLNAKESKEIVLTYKLTPPLDFDFNVIANGEYCPEQSGTGQTGGSSGGSGSTTGGSTTGGSGSSGSTGSGSQTTGGSSGGTITIEKAYGQGGFTLSFNRSPRIVERGGSEVEEEENSDLTGGVSNNSSNTGGALPTTGINIPLPGLIFFSFIFLISLSFAELFFNKRK